LRHNQLLTQFEVLFLDFFCNHHNCAPKNCKEFCF